MFANNETPAISEPEATESSWSEFLPSTKDTLITGASLAVMCYFTPACAAKAAYMAMVPAYHAYIVALGAFEFAENGAILGPRNINLAMMPYITEAARGIIGASSHDDVVALASNSDTLKEYNSIIWFNMFDLLREFRAPARW